MYNLNNAILIVSVYKHGITHQFTLKAILLKNYNKSFKERENFPPLELPRTIITKINAF